MLIYLNMKLMILVYKLDRVIITQYCNNKQNYVKR